MKHLWRIRRGTVSEHVLTNAARLWTEFTLGIGVSSVVCKSNPSDTGSNLLLPDSDAGNRNVPGTVEDFGAGTDRGARGIKKAEG